MHNQAYTTLQSISTKIYICRLVIIIGINSGPSLQLKIYAEYPGLVVKIDAIASSTQSKYYQLSIGYFGHKWHNNINF